MSDEQQNEPEESDMEVIDSLRAPTREDVRRRISEGVQAANRRRWEADAALSPEAGVGGRTAERRKRTAKKRLRQLADREAFITQLMSQRRSEPFEAPIPADTRRQVSDIEDDSTEGSA